MRCSSLTPALAILLASAGPAAAQIATGAWIDGPDLVKGQATSYLDVLPDGRPIVTGGFTRSLFTGDALDTVEILDEAQNAWVEAPPFPGTPRGVHFTWALPDGTLLLAGGMPAWDGEFCGPNAPGFSGAFPTDCWLFHPDTGEWTETAPLPFGIAATHVRQVVLRDGRALLAGGETYDGLSSSSCPFPCLAEALLYTPAQGGAPAFWDFTRSAQTGAITSLHEGRGDFGTVVLPDGRVMLVGGRAGVPGFPLGGPRGTAEIFDPATGEWTLTQMPPVAGEDIDGVTPVPGGRDACTATLLPDGTVLVIGGEYLQTPDVDTRRKSTLYYRPATDTWERGPDLLTPHSSHAAVPQPNGDVLVMSGFGGNPDGFLAECERYVAATGSFVPAPPLPAGTADPNKSAGPAFYPLNLVRNVVPLSGGRVLLAGLTDENKHDPLRETFIFSPGAP
jgi:hypothetical protein